LIETVDTSNFILAAVTQAMPAEQKPIAAVAVAVAVAVVVSRVF